TLIHVQFPQRPDKANGSTGSFELKFVVRGLGEVNLTGGCGYSGPPEAIRRTQRTELRKIPSWLFAERSLPTRREWAGARRERDGDRAHRYSKSGSNKHSLQVRSSSQPSPWQASDFTRTQRHASVAPRVFSEFRRGTSGLHRSCCRCDRSACCRSFT